MTMKISEVPDQTLTPFIFIKIGEKQKFDSLSTTIKGLLIGKSLKNTNSLQKVSDVKKAEELYGENSELSKMCEAYFKNNSTHPIHCIGLVNTARANTGVLKSALKLIGDEVFHVVGSTLSEPKDLQDADEFFKERFKAMSMLGGNYITSKKDTADNLIKLANQFNSKHISIVEGGRTSDNKEESAIGAVIGKIVESGSFDPAIPFQGLTLEGISPRIPKDRLSQKQRNDLLTAGISTLVDSHTVKIEAIVTTYKRSDNGAPDQRFKYLNPILLAGYVRSDLANQISAKYGRAKAGADGKNYAPGQTIATPNTIRAEIIAKIKEWEYKGFVQKPDESIKTIIVEVDGNNITFSYEVDLMGQLRVVKGQILI